MTIQLGQVAPDFEQNSTHGPIRFHEWLGSSWGLLFSHPKNFTPVCTTELGEVAKLRPEWDKMLHPGASSTATVRSVFVIDPAKKVRLILTYPPSTGRNFAEILRAIDSLQLTDARSIATPVNWTPGEPVVISPKLSDDEATRQFPQGYRTLKPYLRIVDLQAGRP